MFVDEKQGKSAGLIHMRKIQNYLLQRGINHLQREIHHKLQKRYNEQEGQCYCLLPERQFLHPELLGLLEKR